MSNFNERLRKMEETIAGDMPTFENSCKRRWTMSEWFHRLGAMADPSAARAFASAVVAGLPDDDEEMMRQFRECADDFELLPAPGMVPAEGISILRPPQCDDDELMN